MLAPVVLLLTAHVAVASTLIPVVRSLNPTASLSKRDLPLNIDSFIPESCLEECTTTRSTYEACVRTAISEGEDVESAGDCEALCEQEVYDEFIDCQNCAIAAWNRTYTEAEADVLREANRELHGYCVSIVARTNFRELSIPTEGDSSESAAARSLHLQGGSLVVGLVGIALATVW